VAILVIFVHHTVGVAKYSVLGCVIQILETGGFGHGVAGRCVLRGGWENLAEGLENFGIFGPVLLGELHVELDVHVAEVVMPGRRHTLAANHLDSV
jgi:hypothetical protein